MSNCDFCERPIPAGASVCHHCGRPQATPPEVRRKWIKLASVAIAALVIMVVWNRLVGFQR